MEKTGGIRRVFRAKWIPLVIAIALVVAVFTLINSNFLGENNLKGIANAASVSGTLAVGLGCLLISGNVDLAAGAEGMMGGVLAALMIRAGVPWPVAIVIALLFGAAAGAFNALLVNKFNFMAFIATIGMSSVYKGLGYVITKSENVAIHSDYASFYKIGSATLFKIPVPFIITLVLFIVYGVILARTRFGRTVYMCGGNQQAARLAGINPKRITTILFINCGVISSLCGVVLASRMHLGSPNSVLGSEMDGITAAVLGGIAFSGGSGGMFGCFLGLVLINCFKNGLNVIGMQAYWQTFAQGILLLLALTLDYFNERARMKALKAEK